MCLAHEPAQPLDESPALSMRGITEHGPAPAHPQ
jgi:hypothetical protein